MKSLKNSKEIDKQEEYFEKKILRKLSKEQRRKYLILKAKENESY